VLARALEPNPTLRAKMSDVRADEFVAGVTSVSGVAEEGSAIETEARRASEGDAQTSRAAFGGDCEWHFGSILWRSDEPRGLSPNASVNI